jgi:protein-disulfide isomerase
MSVSARLKTVLETGSSLAVIVAAGVLVWKVGFAPSAPAQAAPEPVQPVENVRVEASRLTNVTGTGDVVIVEFTDFQCPFCGRHARDTYPALRKELIDSGKARYASVNYPLEQLHPGALPAAKAAECAGEQGKYWEMHAKLFLDATATSAERVAEHVKALELDGPRFKECFAGDKVTAKVKGDQAEGQRLGINSTPTFLVGRMEKDGGVTVMLKINGAHPVDVFAKAVEDVRSGNVAKS